MIYYTLTGKNWSIQKQIIPYSYEFRSVVNKYSLTKYIFVILDTGDGGLVHDGESPSGG